jgi:hypothetical protein
METFHACHGPQQRAIQAIVRFNSRADARLLDGPVKRGHDMVVVRKPNPKPL